MDITRAAGAIERLIVVVLIAMLIVIVIGATGSLGWSIVDDLVSPPFALFHTKQLFDLFGQFVMVLIGLELLKVMRLLVSSRHLDPAVVVEVAIIAICNKVLTTNVKEVNSSDLLGVAGLLAALALAYWALRRSNALAGDE
jgi:uncharacterized membrane protein (DUF373 family)